MTLHFPMAVGLNKGHEVRRSVNKLRHSGHQGPLTKFMRNMIWEVCGFTTYQQHAMELFKVSKDKHELRFIMKGGHTEKVGGVEQHAGTHEEGGGQEGLMNSPPIKDHSYSYKKKELFHYDD